MPGLGMIAHVIDHGAVQIKNKCFGLKICYFHRPPKLGKGSAAANCIHLFVEGFIPLQFIPELVYFGFCADIDVFNAGDVGKIS